MYSYTLYKEASQENFENALNFLSKKFPDYIMRRGYDPYGSADVAVFTKGNNKIVLKNDYDVYALYVDSTIEIEEYRPYQIALN